MKVVEYLKTHGVEKLKEEFSIIVKEYEELYVLNYNQIESPKNHPIVMECRGLILDTNFNVVSRSFDRFFNYTECDAGVGVPLEGCWVHEKVDGSLIKIYNYKGTWYVSTRGTAYAESCVGDFGITFKDLVFKALRCSSEEEFQTKCNAFLYEENTYIFEVTSRENRVVTPYTGYTLWYLACRTNHSGEYLIPHSVEKLGAVYPKKYSFNTVEDMLEASKNLPDLEEGYVVYKEGVPIYKVKSPLYLTVHRIRGEGTLTNKRVMQLILMGEEDEYLTYYPEDKKFFKPFKEAHEVLKTTIEEHYLQVKHITDKKEFALQVKDSLYSAVMFQARARSENPIKVWNAQRESYKLKILEGWCRWL